ncbi:MAG: tRNA (adenosine(37)-N6)-dimethylallyltransferase MiaA [Pseudomonadota bacterium]
MISANKRENFRHGPAKLAVNFDSILTLSPHATGKQHLPETTPPPPTVILIAGPTASGKSDLALALANRLGADIINADASQVYGDLPLLSARPGDEELAQAAHHLYGHVDGATRYSVGQWSRDVAVTLADCARRQVAAIMVGGTGLYFRALESGLSPIPAVPDAIMRDGMAHYDEMGAEAFAAEVIAVDPPMVRLAPNDRQRLVRAWSVYRHSGTPLSVFQAAPGEPVLQSPPTARLVLMPDRNALYDRCDHRFEAMLAAGALAEVAALKARKLSPTLPVMSALGARELMDHLAGSTSLDAATALAQRNTRRFAKRQMTWFRNQTATWPIAPNIDAALERVLDQLPAGIKEARNLR